MYPVSLGIEEAKNRIKLLIVNGHHAEALLTGVFTFEKTIHRTLKQLIISAGFRNKDATKLLRQVQGFNKMKEVWPCFDPSGKTLPQIIGNDYWQNVAKSIKMRNNLVHGTRVYGLALCEEMAKNTLALIDQTVSAFEAEYSYDGWKRLSVRKKSTLHSDPKVHTNE